MLLIFDEWLYHDLLGGENRLGAVQFIFALSETKDQIIILKNSPFHKKWRELIDNSPLSDSPQKMIRGMLLTGFELDPDKIVYFEDSDIKNIKIPRKIKVKPDDAYLVKLALLKREAILITTDTPLFSGLKSIKVNVVMRDDFIISYSV